MSSKNLREIAKRLKRSVAALRKRLVHLGGERKLSARVTDGHTKSELVQYLSCSRKTVQRWIDDGLLKGRYEGRNREDDTLRVTDEDFRAFWKKHPWEAGAEGEPIAHLHPIDSLKANGAHAVVVEPTLVKVDMFRFGRTCQLLIVKHEPLVEVPGKRPELKSTVLFRGVDGHLALEPEAKGREAMGAILPEFYSRSGEKNDIPIQFRAVVQAATLAVSCIDCRHSHFLLGGV